MWDCLWPAAGGPTGPVSSCTTPPSAALPQAAPPPRSTSAPVSTSRGTLLHVTQPPNGSLSGTPSSNTSERLAPLGPSPRSETPWAVGLAVRLSLRRKRLKPGTLRNAPSSVVVGAVRSCEPASTDTPNGTSATGCAARLAVTATGSSVSVCAASPGSSSPSRSWHAPVFTRGGFDTPKLASAWMEGMLRDGESAYPQEPPCIGVEVALGMRRDVSAGGDGGACR